MNTFSLLHYWIACCCLLLSTFNSFAQTDCEPPTGIVAEFLYPFGDQLRVYWDYVPENYYRLTYGEPGFDPLLNEGDDIIETNSFVVYGPVLPAEIHFDVYVQTICAEGDTSNWAGPYDLYRDLPPNSCGYDIEHACEIFPNDTCAPFFFIPSEYHDEAPYEVDMGCNTHQFTAWYTFEAPQNGEVMFELGSSSSLNVFDAALDPVYCESIDSCQIWLSVDSVFLSLIPGEIYFASTVTALFCDSGPNPFYGVPVGMCVISNSPELLCDGPTNFEVNFQYPFGESAFGTWQGDFGNYEVYYGEVDFDPYVFDGDSLIPLTYSFGDNGFWTNTYFPADIHNDAYIRQVCDSVTSDWVGPIDIYRPPPPDSCGWDMEHACELFVSPECDEYFIIPEEFQDYSTQTASCHGYDRAGWYTFTVPETGEIVLDFATSSQYYVLYDSFGDEVGCFNDTCILGFAPVNLNEPIPLTLNPGEQYFVATAINLFWGDPCIPYWYSSGLCIQGQPDSLQVILDPPFYEATCDEPAMEPEIIITGGCPPYEVVAMYYGFPGGCPEPIQNDYTVTDNCGTQITVSYFQVWEQDQSPPEVDCSGLPDSLMIPLGGELILPDFTDLLIIEDCDFLGDTVFGGSIIQSPSSGTEYADAGALTIEFIVTDPCFNETTCVTAVELYSELEPLIVTHTMDTIYECDVTIPPFDLEITGGCPPYDVIGEEESFGVDDCETVTQSYFTVEDDCGQIVYVEHEYLVTDTTPPVVICPETDTIFTTSNGAPYNFIFTNFEVIDCNETEPLLSSFEELEFLEIGEYTDVVITVDICGNVGSCSYPLIVYSTVGLVEVFYAQLNIFQQNDLLIIDFPEQIRGQQCQLYDFNGKRLREITLSNEPTSIDLSGLSAGAYLLTFSDGEQVRHSRRVRVE